MEGPTRQQYCLKWNNHKVNISGVFDRLRDVEKFCDVTLASEDQQSIKCHRILLSAGSGYLEKILDQNPSDHPTIVLSKIKYSELKHLVDFMYSGEVAVEQDHLSKLLEAANILQIKGLYESHEDDKDESNDSKKVPENKNDQPTNQLPVNKVMANQNSALKGDMLIRNPNRVKRKSTA